MVDVAMFPLGSVLFPHMPLPLRVFEDRYLVMLARVLDTAEPEFGVVLIERGHEAGGGDQRFSIGTMARIAKVTSSEQEVAVIAEGRRRIEVVRWLEDDPHPAAEVRELPSLIWSDELEPLRIEAERVVRRVLSRAAEFTELTWDPDVELSSDPIESSWQLAAIAPLGDLDQIQLLRATSAEELLTSVIALTLDAEPGLTAASADEEFESELAELLGDTDDPDDPDPGSDGPSPR